MLQEIAEKMNTQSSGAQELSATARPTASNSSSPELLSLFAIILDFLAIAFVGIFAFTTSDTWISTRLGDFVLYSSVLALLMVCALGFTKGYKFSRLRSPARAVIKALLPYVGAFSVFVVASYLWLSPIFLDQRWFFYVFIFGFFGVCCNRVIAFGILAYGARRGLIRKRIAILGASKQAALMLTHLGRDRLGYIDIVGVFDDRAVTTDRIAKDITVTGTVDDLSELARLQEIDDIIVALPWSADERLRAIIDKLRALPVYVHLGADLAALQMPGKFETGADQLLPLMTVVNNPLSGWRRVLKAMEDRILAVIATIVFAPVMVLVALAIKLDSPGPILYKQRRYGFNNQIFSVYKFRSMTHASEPVAGVTTQAQKDDQRITKVGKFIRRTSLDELPQLLNVLNGSMSLVGPRPHAIDHNEQYGRIIDGYYSRHKVKPGITGLAQINGLRGETDTLEKMEYRVRYDLYYIENWSILMDLEILALTVFLGFFGKNAY